MQATCTRTTCTKPPATRGMCESHYRQRIRMGIYGLRDAAPVHAHLNQLRDIGWTWQQIADAAGVSTYVPHQVGTGRTRNLRVESANRLLAIPLVPRDSHRGINPAGTRRRVQALAWMGWPCHEVARRAGTTAATLRTLILPTRRISYALAARVAAVYDELALQHGPSKIAAAKARTYGFAPPLAWDATGRHGIDNPTATPIGIGHRNTQPA